VSAATAPGPLLAIRGVKSFYGNVMALKGVDLDVNAGEIVTLIGANGAGKSTLMMTIFGKPRAREGRILFDGTDITRLPTHEIARLRIAQSPEGRRIFPRMTVLENLQMGAIVADPNYFAADLERVFTLFPILRQRQGQRGGTLSGGQQQMLALARALLNDNRLLLVDEPTKGLAPRVVGEVADALTVAAQRVPMLLVEQDLRVVARLAHDVVVMAEGRVVHTGTAAELFADTSLVQRLLGVHSA